MKPRGGVDGGVVDCRGADGAAGESVWVGGGGWSVLEKSEAAANKVLNDQKYRHTSASFSEIDTALACRLGYR